MARGLQPVLRPHRSVAVHGGLDCLPWFEEGTAPPGYEDLGVCGMA